MIFSPSRLIEQLNTNFQKIYSFDLTWRSKGSWKKSVSAKISAKCFHVIYPKYTSMNAGFKHHEIVNMGSYCEKDGFMCCDKKMGLCM